METVFTILAVLILIGVAYLLIAPEEKVKRIFDKLTEIFKK